MPQIVCLILRYRLFKSSAVKIGDPFYYYFICNFEAVSASISFRLLALVVVMLMPFLFLIPMPYFLLEKKDLMLRPENNLSI